MKTRRSLEMLLLFVAFSLGGLVVHTVVMFVEMLTLPVSFVNALHHASGHGSLWGLVWSIDMLPMAATYGFLTAAITALVRHDRRLQRQLAREHAESERMKVVVSTLQAVVTEALVGITQHNNRVRQWLQSKSSTGSQVSEHVDQPTRAIAAVLQSLSRGAFADLSQARTVADLERILQALRRDVDARLIEAGNRAGRTQVGRDTEPSQ